MYGTAIFCFVKMVTNNSNATTPHKICHVTFLIEINVCLISFHGTKNTQPSYHQLRV